MASQQFARGRALVEIALFVADGKLVLLLRVCSGLLHGLFFL